MNQLALDLQPIKEYRIPLSQGKTALVDEEDFSWLSSWKWHALWSPLTRSYCAVRNSIPGVDGKRYLIYMHREILKAPSGTEVDHRSMDRLDNRKKNLRLATHAQNQHNRGKQANNTSGYKGVVWFKPRRKWVAKINVNGLRKHLGYFDNPNAAYQAYCSAAAEYHREFARH